MDKELLHRFLLCRTTEREEAQIADWLEADAGHRKELDAMQLTMEGLALRGPEIEKRIARRRSFNLRRYAVRSAVAASIAVVGAGVGFWIASESGGAKQFTAIEVPPGNRMSLTLGDGTRVWLNAGSKLEYPSVFKRRGREVNVSGEALFDVVPDSRSPFTVHTFAADIEVVGTRFNVEADAAAGVFSTALLEGVVRLTSQTQQLTLSRGDIARLETGTLRVYNDRGKIEDEALWVDGILNLRDHDFATLVKSFETTFNVTIVNNCTGISPAIRYERGKIWVSEGVDHALDVLQDVYPFTWKRDRQTNTIILTDK